MVREDFDALHERLLALSDVIRGLRQENSDLRHALATTEAKTRDANNRIQEASERLERLLADSAAVDNHG
ncbi:MAG: hypothetical protein EBT03_00320 [Betaproteobacteria bacterium]|nr:hypothetical protein [Betaproteobacteria bacterium]NBT74781.1 hypothetical protein [Betaproteobacteria bacterium]NBY13661.1 hypothetical protein [Betaproteobacteria bacterium]NCA17262.1 hypothetical protein [Betaproteobacteria bacterium]NDF04783.1 hypothetical protein [Betaproteobacteria bacterium]